MSSYTLLIVDDEEFVRNALVRSLRKEGYHILTAPDAHAAWKVLTDNKVDLIISDNIMPHVSGIEFFKKVKEDYPDTMRIMLTGQADMATAVEAINQGEIYRFIMKPWDDDEIKVSIKIALNQLDVMRENRRLQKLVKEQQALLDKLMANGAQAATPVRRDESGAILIEEDV